MNIGIDMDNVLADLSGPWAEWIAKRFDLTFTKEKWTAYHIYGIFPGIKPAELDGFLDTPGVFRDLNPLPDAVRVTSLWAQRGHNIIIHTAAHPQHWVDKCVWLDKHFPHIASCSRIATKAKQFLRFDVRIDDAIHNLAGVENEVRILFDQPWNHLVYNDTIENPPRRWPYDIRVGSWTELEFTMQALERAASMQQPLPF